LFLAVITRGDCCHYFDSNYRVALARRRICRARTPPGVTGPLFFSIVNVFFSWIFTRLLAYGPRSSFRSIQMSVGALGKKKEGKPHSSSSSSSFFSDVMATLALYYTTVAVLRTLICFKLGGLLLQPLPCAFPYLVVNAPLRFYFFLFSFFFFCWLPFWNIRRSPYKNVDNG
jgi:hypothetical protein